MLLLHWYCPVGIAHLIMSFSPCPMYMTWMVWSDLTTLLVADNLSEFDAQYVERCSPGSTPGQPCDQLHCQGTTSISWGQNQNSRRFFLNIEHALIYHEVETEQFFIPKLTAHQEEKVPQTICRLDGTNLKTKKQTKNNIDIGTNWSWEENEAWNVLERKMSQVQLLPLWRQNLIMYITFWLTL